jgi:hypothetical protein
LLNRKVYFLNTTCVPGLKSLLLSYNQIKYAPIISITFGTIAPYFAFLEILLSGVEIVLTTITELGCKTAFTKEAFIAKISNKISNLNKKDNIKNEQNEINQTPIKILLSDSRKIFFGYNSSLLYEASKLGHVVINILDEIIPNLIFKTHYTLDINNFETGFINQINESNIRDIKLIKLKDRVMNALNIINKIEDESIQN